jgi:hypothetical protein
MVFRRRTRAQDRAHRIEAERRLIDDLGDDLSPDLMAERNEPPPF